MKLLVIGGTKFVGRHMIAEALSRGHEVTMFNRGSNRDVFPEVAWLQGDRNTDVESLKGKSFDAVIDTCGYTPQQLDLTNKVLEGVAHYTFISTISVYAEPLPRFANEEAATAKLEHPTTEITNESYGPLKVLCETLIQNSFGRSLILRPGIIVGPHDPTDRFSYWVYRASQGGNMLAPLPSAPLQYIDARDLARFTLDSLEASLSGIYNIVTPAGSFNFGDLLKTALSISKATTQINWVSDPFLEQAEVSLPLWVPQAYQNWWQVSSQRAVQHGLKFSSLERTIADTLAWLSSIPDYHPKAGLAAEQEQQLLKKYQGLTK